MKAFLQPLLLVVLFILVRCVDLALGFAIPRLVFTIAYLIVAFLALLIIVLAVVL